MKFTISWLKEYLETDATLGQIAEKLTDIGLEVEGVEDELLLLDVDGVDTELLLLEVEGITVELLRVDLEEPVISELLDTVPMRSEPVRLVL